MGFSCVYFGIFTIIIAIKMVWRLRKTEESKNTCFKQMARQAFGRESNNANDIKTKRI